MWDRKGIPTSSSEKLEGMRSHFKRRRFGSLLLVCVQSCSIAELVGAISTRKVLFERLAVIDSNFDEGWDCWFSNEVHEQHVVLLKHIKRGWEIFSRHTRLEVEMGHISNFGTIYGVEIGSSSKSFSYV